MSKVRVIPVAALKNITVLPGMLLNFDIARKSGIAAVEHAMLEDAKIFLVSQRDPNEEAPDASGLYEIGVVALIKQMLKLPGNVVRVLCVGEQRARLVYSEQLQEGYMSGTVELLEDAEEAFTGSEEAARLRYLKELVTGYSAQNNQINKSIYRQLLGTNDILKLMEQISVQIPLDPESRQALLEAETLADRFECLCRILIKETEVISIHRELQGKVRARVDKNQKEYVMREQLRIIREELGESDSGNDADGYMEETEKLDAPEYVKLRLKKEIERFRTMAGSSAESTVSRGYIETLLSLPWNKKTTDRSDIAHAEKILNRDHYGLTKVKERILEFLAVRTMTEKGDSPIICLVGPPGTGKTSIARSVAEALNKEYVRICLGGVKDEAEIRGHRRTYIGALPGRLVAGLKQAGASNPLMLLDEIDKVSSDYKGDVSSALLEVLDSEQNSRFTDHYLEIPVDLSDVLFIATANNAADIPRPLLDRMEVIEVNSYTSNEKYHIAKDHLFKKQLAKNGLNSSQLKLSQKALKAVIEGYTREAGVRSLERKIGQICRKAVKEIVSDASVSAVSVNDKNLEKYLGKPKYLPEKARHEAQVGIVHGLAWTAVGGDTLEIEVNTMPGKGVLELTGQLGDVMKESARAGLSYLRSVADTFGVPEKYFEEHDIHIHIPEGAVPKDGPSAGITMATALISAVTKRKVRADIAMTGEITLRGRVLPVGGLKEKLLAAKTAGIRLVMVPDRNRNDIEELDAEITDGLEVRFVKEMKEVLDIALI